METFVPYEKLSKKKKRELDQKRRGSWNGLNPVTRIPPNPKAYKRQKARKWNDDSSPCFCYSEYGFAKKYRNKLPVFLSFISKDAESLINT